LVFIIVFYIIISHDKKSKGALLNYGKSAF
jgi:hypothetical protein